VPRGSPHRAADPVASAPLDRIGSSRHRRACFDARELLTEYRFALL